MKTKDFKFKQFAIFGGQSGMPVSTDGVMLGAWFAPTHNAHILDIGTGTGLLSLMAAQRFPDAQITALDIDAHAYQAAEVNFQHSPWAARLSLHLQDVLDYVPTTRFDAIVCNPPYFNSGEQAQNAQRATARHTDALRHDALLIQCRSLLHSHGCASFILPKVEGDAFIALALRQGWHLKRRCVVRPSERKPEHRLLFSLSLQACDLEQSTLTIHTQGQYSAEFVALTRDFYLKMTK